MIVRLRRDLEEGAATSVGLQFHLRSPLGHAVQVFPP